MVRVSAFLYREFPSPLRSDLLHNFTTVTYQGFTTLFIRLPFWALVYLPKRWRPRASWTWKRSIMVKLTMPLMTLSAYLTPVPNHLSITEGPGVKGVWVEATPDLITGDLQTWTLFADVKPCCIPGYWLDRAGGDIPVGQKPVPGEKVLYCLHGGAYTFLTAHPNAVTSVIARGILQHCKSIQRAFSIEYRLSSTVPFPKSNPFPAALLDALAGYDYLINNVGFDPSDIVIAGDSAGGNLALALTRYLLEYSDRTELPRTPGSIILVSPWGDLGHSHDGPDSSLSKFDMDFLDDLNSDGLMWCKQAFVGPHGIDAADTNSYISPASLGVGTRFKGFPRTFLIAGGAERLYDSIVTLKERMVADMGEGDGEGQVTYYEAPDAVHDYLLFLWHDPERTDTLQAISKWL